MGSENRGIVLDRDGTLIQDILYLNDVRQIVYLPGVFVGLRILRDCGFKFFVATNQSGVPRGVVDVRNLDAIHAQIKSDFAKEGVDLLAFYSAPFMTDNNHTLRKPNPGMMNEAAAQFDLNKVKSWMIGDRMTDVEAGHRALMRSVLIGTTESPQMSPYMPPEIHAPTLLDAARIIAALP